MRVHRRWEFKFEIRNLNSSLCGRGSGGVGGGGDVSSVAGPVGVDEGARVGQELIGVCPKVVSLGLDQVSWNLLRSRERKFFSRLRSIFLMIHSQFLS